jgi:hypothetical protein
MFNLFNISSSELDSKIEKLSGKIERAQPFFGSPSKYDWDEIFELCKEINENFKGVRYPTKHDRDTAWQTFFSLRDKAHKIRHTQVFDRSKEHYDELMSRLHSADYDAIADFVVGKVMFMGLLKATPDEMKEKGRELGKIGAYFKSVKHEMTKDHKATVHERMIEVRQNHDGFWGQYKSYNAEKSKMYEQKQQAWQEKQEKSRQIKARIESNLESNKEKLYKAKNALDHFERKRDDLKDKIYDSHSENWKSKAEGWLDEFNDKIRDIESQIDRIEKWIEEDRDKLNNWN